MDVVISKLECYSIALTPKSRPATLNIRTDHVSIAILKASAALANKVMVVLLISGYADGFPKYNVWI